MPTYEYRCRECGHELEVVQSFTDDSLTECPVCAGELRKVFHPVGISFKGSGFYKTDARSASKKSGDGEKAKPSESTGDSSSSKGESKSKGDSKSKGGDSSSKAEAKSA